ncbi:hypothetical protein ACFVHB_15555 [Kitasatospora sp. NPDC127111]|uniref:hypothetical protein n=1 Tax=Kitasatospora sp. NPDC127111 TaxID=3345363 RepID=UPI0036437BB4
MATLLGLIISFAATGEIGAFRLGMSGEEADRLLGGGTGLAGPARSGSGGEVGFKDGSLELWVGPDATVSLLGLDTSGADGRFQSPSRINAATREDIEAPSREALISGLGRLGCAWHPDDALTFDGQLAVRTEAGVSVVFTRPAPPADEWVLASLYRSAAVH